MAEQHVELACHKCGSEEIAAWYETPECQGVTLLGVREDGSVEFEYDGCGYSADPGDDFEYRCRGCDNSADTLEELIGLPPVGKPYKPVNAWAILDALEELLAEETERFERAMLEVWLDEDPDESDLSEWTREKVSQVYGEEHQLRAEGALHPKHGYRMELSSEDYESLDGQEGFENGWLLATSTVRKAAGIAQPTEEVAA